jgi:hypothetical protein
LIAPLAPVLVGAGAGGVLQLLGAPGSVTPSPSASQVAGSTPVVTGPVCAGVEGCESLFATAFLWCRCLPVVAATVPPV